jgi:DNA repair protein RadC
MEANFMYATLVKDKIYNLTDSDLYTNHEEDRPYVLRVRDLAEEEKPREKLLKYGPAMLSLSELLAIVLNAGTKKEGVLSISGRLLKEYGERAIVNEINPKKIAEAFNIPLVKSCQLVACVELGRRFFKTDSAGRPEYLRTAKQVYTHLKDMANLPKEHLRGLYLNSQYKVIHDEVISIGSLSANIVHPREVFKPAFEHSAAAIILAHNHPSGIAKPSLEDLQITEQLVSAGKFLGIHLLDHVIIAKKGFQSVPINYN